MCPGCHSAKACRSLYILLKITNQFLKICLKRKYRLWLQQIFRILATVWDHLCFNKEGIKNLSVLADHNILLWPILIDYCIFLLIRCVWIRLLFFSFLKVKDQSKSWFFIFGWIRTDKGWTYLWETKHKVLLKLLLSLAYCESALVISVSFLPLKKGALLKWVVES